MNKDPQQHFFTQIDVSPTPGAVKQGPQDHIGELCLLMREMLSAQDRQNELLEELVDHFSQPQRQRTDELALWKQANPGLAVFCRKAAEQLGRVQTDYLARITEEIQDNVDNMIDGEFMFNEFVDRFGPRFAHLNGILQVLSQLGNAPDQIPSQRRVK